MRTASWSSALALLAGVAATLSPHAAAAQETPEVRELREQIKILQSELNGVVARQAQVEQRAAQTAQQVKTDETTLPHVAINAAHKLSLQSADGQFSIGLTGRLHLDTGGYVNYAAQPGNATRALTGAGFNARRARLGVTGTAWGDWGYTVIWDGGNSQDTAALGLETAQITFTGLKSDWYKSSIELGYSDTFFTMDESVGSNDIMFIERSVPGNIATGINAGDSRANAGGRFWTDRLWLGGYMSGPQSTNDSHTLSSERLGAFQRVAYQILQGPDYSVHLGMDFDELIRANNGGNNTAYSLTLSDRPDLRLDRTALISTGALATIGHDNTSATVYDAEAAAEWQSLLVEGEYFHYDIERDAIGTSSFDGGYVQAGYVLTGEPRKYNPATGAYPNPVPAHPFSLKDDGWGAFELAARVDYINLTDNFQSGLTTAKQEINFANGGRALDFTLGLNWYPNNYIRFMLNYIHSQYDKANATTTAGKAGALAGYNMDAVALRTQVSW